MPKLVETQTFSDGNLKILAELYDNGRVRFTVPCPNQESWTFGLGVVVLEHLARSLRDHATPETLAKITKLDA
jgi:hypothetical protein